MQVFASIDEWRTGRFIRADFSANTFADVYRSHIQFLASILDRNPRGYHHMMSKLYEEALYVRFVMSMLSIFLIFP